MLDSNFDRNPASKISVIIPTSNRPDLVTRAIQSVQNQDFEQGIEILVVINGNDNRTAIELAQLDTPNLKILQIPESGASHARNAGVNAASSEWIAFLDDDDEWFPEKLKLQYAAAIASPATYPIIASKLIARTPKGDFERPRRVPFPGEPLSDYLLGRNGFFQGEGLIQTSVIFTKRSLLLQIPFRQLPKHQDWDWILRVSQNPDVAIEFIPDVLAIWYLEENRTSVSSKVQYENSLNWIRENRHLVTPRAYAAFLLIEVSAQAAHQGHWHQFPKLLMEALRLGKPKPIELLLFFTMWFFPVELRRQIRAKLSRSTTPKHSSEVQQA
jgi:glycosyltransferase involved in cell wall biosynthesis